MSQDFIILSSVIIVVAGGIILLTQHIRKRSHEKARVKSITECRIAFETWRSCHDSEPYKKASLLKHFQSLAHYHKEHFPEDGNLGDMWTQKSSKQVSPAKSGKH